MTNHNHGLNITTAGTPSDATVSDIYWRFAAMLFPNILDAGIIGMPSWNNCRIYVTHLQSSGFRHVITRELLNVCTKNFVIQGQAWINILGQIMHLADFDSISVKVMWLNITVHSLLYEPVWTSQFTKIITNKDFLSFRLLNEAQMCIYKSFLASVKHYCC